MTNSQTIVAMSDAELWRLLDWQPSPADAPSPEWISWAKEEILSGTEDRRADSMYLCRLMRVVEFAHAGDLSNAVAIAGLIGRDT